MKKIIFILIIFFGTSVMVLNGCYTVLDMPERDYLASNQPIIIVIDYPMPPFPPPPPPPPPPEPRPDPIIAPYIPPSPPYERPREISDLRNGGEGRNPGNNERRR